MRVLRRGLGLVLVAFVLAFAVATPLEPPPLPIAAVTWPPSTSLLVAEIATGSATSGSDEYVELTNAGSSSADLAGLEVVYVTSSGATVTRKASWATATLVEPGRHLLIANVSGRYAAEADVTYSGGLAATGGAIVLRSIGGAPIDALAWGDATNAFVEGAVAPAPAAGSSIERRPGGSGGNVTDTNDNASDVLVNPAPVPQNLAAEPVPAPGPTGTAAPSIGPSATTTAPPTATPTPSPAATATPVSTPTEGPTASTSPTPTSTPTATPGPTPTPTPTPTPIPTPTVVSIADARALPDGSGATVEAVVTAPLGSVDDGHTGYVQDSSGGLAIYGTTAFPASIDAGAVVRATGTIDDRFAQRILRVSVDAVEVVGFAALPVSISVETGAAGEALEAQRVTASGRITAAPDAVADGTAVTIDDGSGPLRVVVTQPALDGRLLATGDVIVVRGPLGQRDSSGTGVQGYRVVVALAADLEVVGPTPSPSSSPAPTTSPTPSVTPSATPDPSPTVGATAAPSPDPTATPTPVPTPSPTLPAGDDLVSIAAARLQPVGSRVHVAGVVTAEAGRLGIPPLIAIQDETGAIVVRLPDAVARPTRGRRLDVTGPLGAPYGQLELRPASSGVLDVGAAPVPPPDRVALVDVGESTEARLVTLDATIGSRPVRDANGDASTSLKDASGRTLKVLADASARVDLSGLRVGDVVRVTGISGQRATRKGALDGYRLWLRDGRDVVRLAEAGSPAPTGSGGDASTGPAASDAPLVSIAVARTRTDRVVTVAGIVVADTSLLDASGRRLVIQDASGGIEVVLPKPDATWRVGNGIRATGRVKRAYDAPRVAATAVTRTPAGVATPVTLDRAPGPADEWRLVRVSGAVTSLHRLGQRWRAELRVAGDVVPVAGLAGAGIPSTALEVGRTAAVVGIVRRPYPNASDRRFAVEPRSPSDVSLGPPAGPSDGSDAPGGAAGTGTRGRDGSRPATTGEAVQDADLGQLGELVGRRVRVGGIVVDVASDGLVVDDGTGRVRVALEQEAAAMLPLVERDDPINAIGTVRRRGGVIEVVVVRAADLIRVAELAASGSVGAGDATGAVAPDGELRNVRLAGVGDVPLVLGVGGLLVATALTLLAFALRRRRAGRLAAAVRARLARELRGGAGVTSASG